MAKNTNNSEDSEGRALRQFCLHFSDLHFDVETPFINNMTILVTGSQGKTASCLTKYLQASKHPLIVASRNPAPNTPYPVARFDWTDPSTLDLPFQHTQALDSPITAAYLVGIDVTNIAELVIRFIHFARSKGVKRFVLLSALDQPKGNPLLGAIHAELEDLGNRHLVEWAVLRPGFFMENFSEESYHRKTIRSEGRIYTASGKGRKAFISARDIAAVAYRVLVDGEAPNGDLVITGGEAVSHDEVSLQPRSGD